MFPAAATHMRGSNAMQNDKKMLTPVNNESVVQQVINKITDAIISGELKPGDRLPPEMELILYDYLEFTNASTFIRLGGSGGPSEPRMGPLRG